ncbi:MAG: hypothetical protein GY717_09800 [Rhodobacteraceae bacterium]|nr:hypothetical protein [Paracoccaceae bacterium]
MPTRRCILAAALLAPVAARAAWAHDGHDLSRLQAEIIGTGIAENGFVLRMRLTNRRDQDVALHAIYTDLGEIAAVLPVSLAPGASADLALTLVAQDWPGIFALVLDFGEAGAGPVTVIPL